MDIEILHNIMNTEMQLFYEVICKITIWLWWDFLVQIHFAVKAHRMITTWL